MENLQKGARGTTVGATNTYDGGSTSQDMVSFACALALKWLAGVLDLAAVEGTLFHKVHTPSGRDKGVVNLAMMFFRILT
eukprot:814358-Amphidinium_carterae.1